MQKLKIVVDQKGLRVFINDHELTQICSCKVKRIKAYEDVFNIHISMDAELEDFSLAVDADEH